MKYRFIRFPGGRAKAVTFSYDDGCRDDIRLADTFTRYGLKCTFNLNSGFLGKTESDRHLTAEEVRKHILSAGHEIAVHGALHKAPGRVRAIDGIRDALECRLSLEKTFGGIVRGMAYPDSGIRELANGATYERIRAYLRDLDIVYARTLGGDNNAFALPTDWYAWMPTAHHTNPNLKEYMAQFLALEAKQNARLFYVWGHSFEFGRSGNWDLLEEICESFSGKQDIWFATNMEIYEYVHAYDSLTFSADGKTVYNPTLLEIWFDIDGGLFRIGSGETLEIS